MRHLLPLLLAPLTCLAAEPAPPLPGSTMLRDYFARQVADIETTQKLPTPKSAEEWNTLRAQWRAELADMLGLNPMPERTPLNAQVTGSVPGEGFVVENLSFQSSPGLYVTANFYRPEKVEKPLPAILYACGHSDVKAKDGGSLGNKTYYQHHGEWFARHGYVCLVIDTVQLGEIRGEHHGTFNQGRWWWMSRGYTPAGVEAWAGIRALDYLESRPEVDRARIGMTGRSGGGAYSWWVSALDERVKVAVPTAGITTLRNYVVDGAVEGHCDCMFMVNSRRWDYDKVAALIAPRPLCIANTDKDTIFPLDGVITVYTHVRALYKALGAEGNIGLQIAEGPHQDTQALNTGAFAWFERFLKGASPMATIDEPATKRLDPELLRVFKDLPKDERNTTIDQSFVPVAAAIPIPADQKSFEEQRAQWLTALQTQVFGAWPKEAPALELRDFGSITKSGLTCRVWEFTSQEPWHLRLYVLHRSDLRPADIEHLQLDVLSSREWPAVRSVLACFRATDFPGIELPAHLDTALTVFASELTDLGDSKTALAFIAPRGIGPTAWVNDPIDVTGVTPRNNVEKMAENHRLRRFYLLGETLDSGRVWDIRRALTAVQSAGFAAPIELRAQGAMATNALYAAIFEPHLTRATLRNPEPTHAAAPIYLNILRYLDAPQAALLAAARCPMEIQTANPAAWSWPQQAVKNLSLEKSLQITTPPKAPKWPFQ